EGHVARDGDPVRFPDLLLRTPARRGPAEPLAARPQRPADGSAQSVTGRRRAHATGAAARAPGREVRPGGRRARSRAVREPSTFGADKPLDGGAMLEEARGSTGIARESGGGDLHAVSIGTGRPSGNPWRE